MTSITLNAGRSQKILIEGTWKIYFYLFYGLVDTLKKIKFLRNL